MTINSQGPTEMKDAVKDATGKVEKISQELGMDDSQKLKYVTGEYLALVGQHEELEEKYNTQQLKMKALGNKSLSSRVLKYGAAVVLAATATAYFASLPYCQNVLNTMRSPANIDDLLASQQSKGKKRLVEKGESTGSKLEAIAEAPSVVSVPAPQVPETPSPTPYVQPPAPATNLDFSRSEEIAKNYQAALRNMPSKFSVVVEVKDHKAISVEFPGEVVPKEARAEISDAVMTETNYGSVEGHQRIEKWIILEDKR